MKHAVSTEWRKFGPDEATELLANRDSNRRLRPYVVEAYAGDMTQGLWRETGEAIKISRTGKLLDGQHRLAAIVESGITLELMVVTGLDDASQVMMDQGSARSVVDALGMHGIQNAAWTGSVARWVLMGGEPGPELEARLKRKASTAQVVNLVKNEPDIALAAARYNSMKTHIPGGPTALGYTWLWLHRSEPAECERFYGSMINMQFPALNDPRKAALKTLQRMEREEGITSSSKDKAIATVSVLTRGWNLFRKGEEVQTIPIKLKNGRIIAPEKPI